VIRIEGAHKRYGDFVALDDVSVTVERGEILVLMGRSGSGKSTLLRCMNGLVRPERGRVLVDDGGSAVDLVSADEVALRRVRQTRVSMVFQGTALLPWRTVGENVALGLQIRGVPTAEQEKAVAAKLALVGLEKWRDKPVSALSGGMQQRVGLARALANDPDLLLLDEPFSALDPLLRERLQDELLELKRALDKTMVFVTHDVDEALKLGSRIAMMEAGRVVQIGTPEEILRAPRTDDVRAFVAHMTRWSRLKTVP
jgi:glycine betaine/proline transport system ATP-binding protein